MPMLQSDIFCPSSPHEIETPERRATGTEEDANAENTPGPKMAKMTGKNDEIRLFSTTSIPGPKRTTQRESELMSVRPRSPQSQGASLPEDDSHSGQLHHEGAGANFNHS